MNSDQAAFVDHSDKLEEQTKRQWEADYAAYMATMKAYGHFPIPFETWKSWKEHNKRA